MVFSIANLQLYSVVIKNIVMKNAIVANGKHCCCKFAVTISAVANCNEKKHCCYQFARENAIVVYIKNTVVANLQ